MSKNEKICLQCNNKFEVYNYLIKQKFCSKECKEKYLDLNNRIIKKCVICNNDFKCNKSIGKWKRTCSKECTKKKLEKIKLEGNEKRKCIICNNIYETFKSSVKKCCSKECRVKYVNRFKIKEHCIICGFK